MRSAFLWIAGQMIVASYVGGCFAPCGLMVAQEPAATSGSGVSQGLRFRRVLVVEEQLQKLADKSYLPMRRNDFLEKLAAVRRNAGEVATQRVFIERCEYSARYERGQLIDGQARLQIYHKGADPVALKLDPCSIAIRDPAWLLAGGEEQPAVLGLDSDGSLVVIVAQSGELTFDWSRRGQLDAAGETRFSLALPPSPITRVDLDLPSELEPAVEGAVVLLQKDLVQRRNEETTADEGADTQNASQPRVMGQRRLWTVQTGGQTPVRLRVLSRDQLTRRPQRVELGPGSVDYAIGASDVQVSFEIPLRVRDDPLEAVTLDIGSEVEIHDLRWQDQVVSYSELPGPETGIRTFRVVLAQAGSSEESVLRISGSAPLQTGTVWRLPVARLREGIWREGQATLEIDNESLQLLQVTPLGGHEVFVESADPSITRVIQFHSAESAVAVVVARRTAAVTVDLGTTLRSRAGTARADVVARVQALQGELFQLTSSIPADWGVELVEADPPDLLESFQVVSALRPDAARERLPQRRVVLQLARSLPRDRIVTFHLTCSKALRAEGPLVKGLQLPLIAFDQGVTRRDLVSVPVEPTRQVELTGDRGVERILYDDLLSTDRQLVEAGPSAMVMTAKVYPPELAVFLRTEPPRFSAEIEVKVDLRDDELVERFEIRCLPESTPLRGFRVSLPGSIDADVEWRFESNRQLGLTARRVYAQDDNQGAIWNLGIVEPQAGPFVVVGTRRSRFGEQHQIGLIRLPETTEQTGTLVFSNHGLRSCRIEGPALSRIPRQPGKRTGDRAIRGTYRYDPGTQTVAWLRQQISSPIDAAFHAWSFQLVSHWARNGHVLHEAAFLIENGGRRRASFRIPQGARWHGIQINGKRVAPPAVVATEAPVVLSLPVGVRFPVVQLLFETIGSELGSRASLAPPDTSIDAPVLQRQWLVWLPSGYAPRPGQEGIQIGVMSRTGDWLRRFLGPLLRPGEIKPFRLLDMEWSGIARTPADIDETDVVERATRKLNALLDASQGVVHPQTWGEWIGSYGGQQVPRLWIDRWQLAAVGITPDTRLPIWRNVAPGDLTSRVLGRWGLRLVKHGEDVVVSSRLQSELESEGARSERRPGAVLAQSWNVDRSQGSPWLHVHDASPAINTRAGTFVRLLDWPKQRDVVVEVYRPGTIQSWAWAVFFLATGGTIWGAARSPRGSLVAVAFSVLVACLVPDILDLVSAAVFLGVVAGIGVRLLWLQPGMVETRYRRRVFSKDWPLWSTGTVAVFGALVAVAGGADEPRDGVDAPVIYEVLFPIDAERRPVGDVIYLPEAFYRRLTALAVASQPLAHDWVVTAANYRCDVARSREKRLAVSQIVAVYDLEARREQQRVAIPLLENEVQIADAHLDGVAIQTRWSLTGDSLEFAVNSQGLHRLELSLLPLDQTQSGEGRFQIKIPEVPQSRFRLESAEPVPGIRVDSALGQTTIDEFGNPSVELGPSKTLSFRWSPTRQDVTDGVDVTFEQIDWLRVRPGRVLFESRLFGRVLAGRVKTVQLEVDSRLRLLDQETEWTVVEVGNPERPGTKTLNVTLPEEAGDEFVLPLTFYLTGTTGVGKLTLPELEVRTGKATRHLFAVSLDDSLSGQPENVPGFISMDAADLTAAWSADVASPDLAYVVSDLQGTWGIMTQLRAATVTADSQLDILFGEREVKMEWVAQLRTAGESVWQYYVETSPEMKLYDVEVTGNGVPLLSHWARAPSGRVSVFLRNLTADPVQVVLRGGMTEVGAEVELPSIEPVASTVNTRRVRVYRDPKLRVVLASPLHWQATDEEGWGRYRSGWGRLVGSYACTPAVEDGVARCRARIQKRTTRVQAKIITRLVPKDGDWSAQSDVSFRGEKGALDALRLEIPDSESTSLSLPEGTQSTSRVLADRDGREWVLYPGTTGLGNFTVQIERLVKAATTSSDLLLPIVPRDVTQTERYLIVPEILEGEPLFWKGIDLRRVVVPPSEIGAEPGHTVFELTARSRVAPVRQEDRIEARVQLADHRVICDSQHRFGASSFHLVAGRREYCVLEVPDGLRLLRVSVDGYPGELTSLGKYEWRVNLGRQPLPQRIEVIYDVPQKAITDRTLFVPRVVSFPVEQTLWYVQVAGQKSRDPEVVEGAVVSELEHGVARLRSLTDLLTTAADTARSYSYQDRSRWYLSWWQRYTETHTRLAQIDAGEGLSGDTAVREEMNTRWRDVGQRLEIVEPQQSTLTTAPGPLTLISRLGDYREGIYLQFTGDQSTLELGRHVAFDRSLMWRSLAVVLTVVVACVAWRGMSRQWNMERVTWHASTGGIVLGLVWWLWLSPSWLGWLIIGCSLLVAMRTVRFGDRASPVTRKTPHLQTVLRS
ncbi:MAG: hypothetical protein CMJ70_09445 [Planctomycetaceae bacterium]|nr:hypothetical protein [Planctomycetaceae bacterium]